MEAVKSMIMRLFCQCETEELQVRAGFFFHEEPASAINSKSNDCLYKELVMRTLSHTRVRVPSRSNKLPLVAHSNQESYGIDTPRYTALTFQLCQSELTLDS